LQLKLNKRSLNAACYYDKKAEVLEARAGCDKLIEHRN